MKNKDGTITFYDFGLTIVLILVGVLLLTSTVGGFGVLIGVVAENDQDINCDSHDKYCSEYEAEQIIKLIQPDERMAAISKDR